MFFCVFNSWISERENRKRWLPAQGRLSHLNYSPSSVLK
jgi:hypothetical protein